jgi:hypothetical protein
MHTHIHTYTGRERKREKEKDREREERDNKYQKEDEKGTACTEHSARWIGWCLTITSGKF